MSAAPITVFDDLIEGTPTVTATEGVTIPFAATGAPIDPVEIRDRLSANLYEQLTDGQDATAVKAADRAITHVGAIAARLGKALDLDDRVLREIVLLFAVYELHMALGHEEAGKEYRLKAKDLIIAAFGNFPEAGAPTEAPSQAAAVVRPRRKGYP